MAKAANAARDADLARRVEQIVRGELQRRQSGQVDRDALRSAGVEDHHTGVARRTQGVVLQVCSRGTCQSPLLKPMQPLRKLRKHVYVHASAPFARLGGGAGGLGPFFFTSTLIGDVGGSL